MKFVGLVNSALTTEESKHAARKKKEKLKETQTWIRKRESKRILNKHGKMNA